MATQEDLAVRFIWEPEDITILTEEELEDELGAEAEVEEGKALTPEQALLLNKYQDYWDAHR